ncbi:unnamed protein product, partial [Laminaria digitata]
GGKSDDAGKAAPLLLLGGHVCALSLEKKERRLNSAGGLTLREPYAWESDLDVAGFALPRWMWDAVGGETVSWTVGKGLRVCSTRVVMRVGGGALLIHPNMSSPEEQGTPGREARGPSQADAVNFFEPFVQVASWGDGQFHPLLRVASTGLSLEGGPEGVEKGGGIRKAIRTEAGDLEISPAAGLHLLSGTEPDSNVRIGARGERGGIYLSSDVFHWTASSSFANSSGTFAAGEEYEASFRIDEDTLETRGLTTVKLGAGRSFDLTVVGWPEGGMADEPSGGAVRGDVESLNASAGVVNVQASDRALISAANGTRVTSATGDVCLDASDGIASLRLSGTDIQGAAPTITFSASAVSEMGTRADCGTLDTTTTRFSGAADRALGAVEDTGGYLNLTGLSAVIGGPGNASVEAGDEVRLRANNSVLRVSTATASIQSTTILLQSSPLRESTATTESHPPLGRKPPLPNTSHGVEALLSLTGGVLAMDASSSVKWETPGAFARLIGRRDSGSHEDVLANGGVGVFVADADAVQIKARSSKGVIITADGAGGVETTGVNAETSSTGARLEVSAEGVSMGGNSTIVSASRRLTLRAGGHQGSMDQKGDPWELKEESGHPGSTIQPERRGVSTVELGDGGVKVRLFVKVVASSSESIFLRAGSGVVLEAPHLTISHNLGGEAAKEENPGDSRHHKTSDGKSVGGDGVGGGGSGGGGGGLWSDGASLTGKADRRVLLQAGLSDGRKTKGDGTVTSRSHISIEEDLVRVCVGGARELALAAPRAGPAANATGISGGGGADFPGKGLSLEVVGMSSLSSTEDLELRAHEVLVSSANQTLVYSPGGLLLAGSPALSSGAAESSKLGAARVGLRQQESHILLAPGVGAGVGIGPVFSSRDLLAPIGRSEGGGAYAPAVFTPVESSGNSAVAVLSPRGAASAVRFGCTGLPYSGGLAVRHHLDGPAGDTLLLELASSPGRIVGDASGRWGVGAVPDSGPAATLHVFTSPKLAEPSGAGLTSAGVPEPAPAFLIESAGAGVMQLLSGTASSLQTAIANAIVLSSRPGGNKPKDDNHWVMSQLGDKAAASRPTWTDASADRSSWAGGMTLTHVSGGGSTGWRTALGKYPPTNEAGSEQIAARPHLALSSNGRSGFGTGSTGARVTVGGALVAEQVLVLSDEGMVRDVDELGNQGREQALEALRKVDVVSFGWTKEASASYGLRPDVRQVGVIAQQVENKGSPSLVWQDAATGRKAVSYSRLLVTLVAAFQHLDGFVHAERKTWDNRLEGLENDAASAAESVRNASDRLKIVEAATEAGIDSSQVHARDLAAVEGRLLEQGGQAQAVGTDLAALQRKVAEDKGDIQEWRVEGSRREQELEKEVVDLKSRLAILEERRKDSLEDQKIRQKAHDEQIQALSLRIGTSHASQSRCDESLLAEVQALRTSQDELESRLAPLLLR